jgi:hypothetical protein
MPRSAGFRLLARRIASLRSPVVTGDELVMLNDAIDRCAIEARARGRLPEQLAIDLRAAFEQNAALEVGDAYWKSGTYGDGDRLMTEMISQALRTYFGG